MNILSISVGGFYLYALAEGAAYAQSKMRFDKIVGASAGAPIALLSAIYGGQKMVEVARQINLLEAYKFIPFTADGKMKLRAMWRFLTGKSIAIQDSLPVLERLILEKDFQNWRNSPGSPDCYVLTVDLQTGQRHLFNLKEYKYQDALPRLDASTLMQGVAKGRYLNGKYLVDGGQLDPSPAHLIADNPEVRNLVCIYSWPENWQRRKICIGPNQGIKEHFAMIETDHFEKCKNDMQQENRLQEKHGFNLIRVHTKRTLKHSFDIDPQRQRAAIDSTIESAVRAFRR